MSTQVIGAAVAGTAVVGGGGALAAYAAGAFDGEKNTKTSVRYSNFLEYAKAKKLGNEIFSESDIGTKLSNKTETPIYKDTIKNSIEKMNSSVEGATKPEKGDFESAVTDKDDAIKKFTHKWCDAVSKKTKTGGSSNEGWTEDEITSDPEFTPFKEICLKPKTSR
ncbi:hypothetical protein MHSWG343_10540 [Candidatus Mycoplasma haematohominis]|uniref:Uncharacterized protein n=1 Tax=Candidatus Mycoplasma haematohominis TaxID=1494318 RepID=A0A478FUN0_9MOLU|nr:hypothetical protein MHSWG343_10540 [Candidatus Mycoplasma haemohominis]